jgi:tRNA(His) guanylyltransferase
MLKDMNDKLGSRMKSQYEMRSRTFLPRRTYTIIRLDGKAFHTFTRGMKRPYDENFIYAMDDTARFLCEEIQGCKMAYVQSDEISLLLTDFATITTDAWFDGQVQKMVSVAASMATGKFNNLMLQLQDYAADIEGHDLENQKLAFFDARVFTIPDPVEVENYFICRQKDAMRNAVSMVAQSMFSHKELQGKSQRTMEEMIQEKENIVSWDNVVPLGFKLGRTFFKNEEGWKQSFSYFMHNMKVNGTEDQRVITQFIPKINGNLT